MTTRFPTKTLYEQDFNLWIEQTIYQLKNCQLEYLDLQHLVEEIEYLGGSDKREIERRITILLSHLLCLVFWLPEEEKKQCARGWKLTIREQRKQIEKLLKKSPSLKPYLEEIFSECYTEAREEVLYKSPLTWDLIPLIPDTCPWIIAEVLNSNYLPE